MHPQPGRTLTLAERLGYSQSDRLLIIHADDLGMSHSANAASIAALTDGVVTCGSVMVPCPWFADLAAWAREHAEADLGVHLTLTSEWRTYRWGPVAPVDQVPSLVDGEGFLWRSGQEFVAHARPDEVAIEIRAQIDRARQFGLRPTHIDTHMGTLFADRPFFEAYLHVSEVTGIPPMLVRPTSASQEIVRRLGLDDPAAVAALEDRSFFFLDRLSTGVKAETYEARRDQYWELIRRLEPGVTQIIVHLAGDDPEIRQVTEGWQARYDEFRIFTDPETRRLLELEGVKTIGYRELGALWPVRSEGGKHV